MLTLWGNPRPGLGSRCQHLHAGDPRPLSMMMRWRYLGDPDQSHAASWRGLSAERYHRVEDGPKEWPALSAKALFMPIGQAPECSA